MSCLHSYGSIAIASAAFVLGNHMFIDLLAHAAADRGSGKESSQCSSQTPDRSTGDCANARDDGPDSATDSRSGVSSSTSAEVSSHSAHAAADSSAQFLIG